MKVLYVDALAAPNAKANIAGMVNAYRKLAAVQTFDYRSPIGRRPTKEKIKRMNDKLVAVATAFKPNFIHLGKCESVEGWAISAIKKALPNTKVIHFFGDYRAEVIPWVVHIGRACDRTVMQIDGGPLVRAYEKAGCKRIGYWPAGVDPMIYTPQPVPSKDLNIVFMGTLGNLRAFPWYRGRRDLVAALAKSNVINVFGRGWEGVKHPHIHHHKYVGATGFSNACSRATVALGYGATDVPGYTSWPRVLNSMACGCFFLTRYFAGLEKTFRCGVHLDWFKSIPEAVEKVNYYSTHAEERERIAKQGREEVLRAHTWDHRIKSMLSYAGFETAQ